MTFEIYIISYFYYLQPPISQIEFLLKILPSYHHIRKANVKPNKNEGGI